MGVFQRNGKWVAQWREGGQIRTLTVGTNKTVARRIVQKKREDELLRRAGVVNAIDEQFARAEGRAIAAHFREFEQHLKDRGVTPREVSQKMARVRKVADYAGLHTLSDMTEDRMQRAIGKMRGDGFRRGQTDRRAGKRSDYSPEAINKYILAIKQFSRWCARTHKASGNPLDGLALFNTRTKRVHDRRAFTAEEIARLLNPANLYQSRTRRTSMTPEDRAMLYRVAMLTGFRAGELRSLTPKSFNMDAFTAEVQAAFSKHRRRDVQPLPVELAESLVPWMAKRPRNKPLWAMAKNMSKVLRRDLEAAGIPYVVGGLYGDFHALRHTYVSRLVAAGLAPKEAQTLARHSTITLTMDRYTHLETHRLRSELAKVPRL